MMGFYDRYVKNGMVSNNEFIGKLYADCPIPDFNEAKNSLPKPFWHGHECVIKCYWETWKMAFGHLKKPTPCNSFVANYIDTCFNDCLFMWDSVIALMYGKYGRRVFDFQQTLDNLYCKQHPDGFICREIAVTDGSDRFHRFDPASTGPNILPWAEWEHYNLTGDKNRLEKVFPVLLAYHMWLKNYRTWQDGSYWSSGWGCGLDNQPRLKPGLSQEFYHGHMSWVDTSIQAIFSAKTLIEMSKVLKREQEAGILLDEVSDLSALLNDHFWNDSSCYYFDRYADGQISDVMTISAYWALLADIVPADKLAGFISHLDKADEYKRVHRIPSMPANQPGYSPTGSYWKGGVWSFTNYMVLRGLTNTGHDDLAYDIAVNHFMNVVEIFNETGTIWENYAPDSVLPGKPALPNFVGAGGVSPISILIEYVLGLRYDSKREVVVWDVRQLEYHGIDNYPYGVSGQLSLTCEARNDHCDEPVIHVSSDVPFLLEIRWNHGGGSKSKIISITGATECRTHFKENKIC